jgi:hypothetical protein
LAQIVTFPMGGAGEHWRFKWLGIDKNYHDDLAHQDDGKNVEVTGALVRINAWYAERVARLALALDAIPEGDGTMLDDTLIVWGNELATGRHSLEDIPVVIVGRARGRKRPFVVDRGRQDYHRLGCSVLRAFGVAAEGFGQEPTCGPVDGLDLV